MSTNLSGVYRLDQTAAEIISEALELLQVSGQGESLSGNDFSTASKSLNRMLKAWEGQGIHLWTQQEGTLFLRKRQAAYDFNNIGKDGVDDDYTHLANEWYGTTLAAALDVGTDPDQLTLTSVAGLTVGSLVGVVNSDRDLEWRRVMSIAGDVVQVETNFTVGAAGGSVVYHYAYDQATVATGVIATQVLTPTDISIFQVGDPISYELDTGGYERNTVTAVGATTISTLSALSAAVTARNVVNLSHRAQPFKPIKRIVDDGVRRRENDDYEIPIVFESRKDYFDLPNKNQVGTVIQTYYSRQEPAGIMYCWLTPSDASPVINFTYERSMQIVTLPTQTLDIPEDWYDAVVSNLAVKLIPKFGCAQARKQDVKEEAMTTLDVALSMDSDVYSIRLVPEQYG